VARLFVSRRPPQAPGALHELPLRTCQWQFSTQVPQRSSHWQCVLYSTVHYYFFKLAVLAWPGLARLTCGVYPFRLIPVPVLPPGGMKACPRFPGSTENSRRVRPALAVPMFKLKLQPELTVSVHGYTASFSIQYCITPKNASLYLCSNRNSHPCLRGGVSFRARASRILLLCRQLHSAQPRSVRRNTTASTCFTIRIHASHGG
jgi:hypothetical protein